MSRTVFLVDVQVLEKDEWKILAKNVPLKEPVYYSNKSINEQLHKQHPEVIKKIPIFTDNRGFSFQKPINIKIKKWLKT
jgi:hypothetical protein